MKSKNMTQNNIHYADHYEQYCGEALENAGINFIHESQGAGLDFYLPDFDIYLEIKQFHADRISRQMAKYDNVIAIQGIKSLDFFISKMKTL